MKDAAGVNILPELHRVEGFSFDHPGGPDPRLGLVRLQYTDRKGSLHQVGIPTMDALYLLNLLAHWSKEEGLEALRQPPT